MKFEILEEEIEKIGGSKESKKAVLKLIDLKTNSDMREVINAIDKFRIEVDSFKNELNTKLETSIGSLKSENSSIKWLIGGIFVAITILLAIVTLKK